MYLLDTDILSMLRKRRRPPGIDAFIASARPRDLFLSVITIGEVERGIDLKRVKDPDAAARLAEWLDAVLSGYRDRILMFDLGAARRWGRLSAAIGSGGADLQIAAIALENGLAVVTHNVAHFAPTGVAVVDPVRA